MAWCAKCPHKENNLSTPGRPTRKYLLNIRMEDMNILPWLGAALKKRNLGRVEIELRIFRVWVLFDGGREAEGVVLMTTEQSEE